MKLLGNHSARWLQRLLLRGERVPADGGLGLSACAKQCKGRVLLVAAEL